MDRSGDKGYEAADDAANERATQHAGVHSTSRVGRTLRRAFAKTSMRELCQSVARERAEARAKRCAYDHPLSARARHRLHPSQRCLDDQAIQTCRHTRELLSARSR